MTRRELVFQHRDEIFRAAARRGATNVRLFGSTARDEAHAGSDIDVLVDLEPGRSLFDLGGLQLDLEELLGCPVDVTTEPGVHWFIRNRVLHEAVRL